MVVLFVDQIMNNILDLKAFWCVIISRVMFQSLLQSHSYNERNSNNNMISKIFFLPIAHGKFCDYNFVK